MKQAAHIFRKDLRRLRWSLLAWCAIVAGSTLLDTAGRDLALAGIDFQLAVKQLSDMLSLVWALFYMVLISRLVHDEPLVSRDAFWLTRPIASRELMTAKLAFAALLFIVVPLLGSLAVAAYFGTDGSAIAKAVPVFVFNNLIVTAPLMALAALTPSLTRYILTMVGIVGAGVLFMSVMVLVGLFIAEPIQDAGNAALPNPTIPIIAACVVALTALAVIVSQYRGRRFARSVAIAAIGVIALFSVPERWPWSLVKLLPAETVQGPSDTPALGVSVEVDKMRVSEEYGFRTRTAPRRDIAVPALVNGLPPEFSIARITARSRLELPNGVVLETPRSNRTSYIAAYAGPSTGRDARSTETTLGVRLLTKRETPPDLADAWPTLLTVGEQEFVRHRTEYGRLVSDLDVAFERPIVRGSLPLVASASVDIDGFHFTIERVFRGPTGCRVLLRHFHVEPLLSAPRYPRFTVVLVNRARQEAVQGDDSHGMVGFSVGGWYFPGPEIGGRGFVLVQSELSFPARSATVSQWIDIAQDWLRNAELVILEPVAAGGITRTITIDKFRMTP